MILRVLTRLAIVWAVLVLGWFAILAAQIPSLGAHGGWQTVLAVAVAPLAVVGALMWIFRRPE